MKQTKPYGRAFKSSDNATSAPPLVPVPGVDRPLPIPAEVDDAPGFPCYSPSSTPIPNEINDLRS